MVVLATSLLVPEHTAQAPSQPAPAWRPDDYRPWSHPALYDTREPGRSNEGHEFRTLSQAEKRALLEYLKVL